MKKKKFLNSKKIESLYNNHYEKELFFQFSSNDVNFQFQF
jgi:hypothetical protein